MATYTRVWDEDELEEYRKPGGCGDDRPNAGCDETCPPCPHRPSPEPSAEEFYEKIKYWTDKYTELEHHARALQVYLDAECSTRRVAEIKLATARTALGESSFEELEKATKEYDAQLIASTLQAAADRVCFDCGLNEGGVPCIDECSERKAILAPLNKE